MSQETWTRRYRLSDEVRVEVYQDACGGFLVTLIDREETRIKLSEREFQHLVTVVQEVKV